MVRGTSTLSRMSSAREGARVQRSWTFEAVLAGGRRRRRSLGFFVLERRVLEELLRYERTYRALSKGSAEDIFGRNCCC